MNPFTYIFKYILQKLANKFLGYRCFNCGKWITKEGAPTHFGEDGESALCADWARYTDKERREAYDEAEQHIRMLQEREYELETQILLEKCALLQALAMSRSTWVKACVAEQSSLFTMTSELQREIEKRGNVDGK